MESQTTEQTPRKKSVHNKEGYKQNKEEILISAWKIQDNTEEGFKYWSKYRDFLLCISIELFLYIIIIFVIIIIIIIICLLLFIYFYFRK